MSEELNISGITIITLGSIIILSSLISRFISKPIVKYPKWNAPLNTALNVSSSEYMVVTGLIMIIWGSLLPDITPTGSNKNEEELMEFPDVVRYIPLIIMVIYTIFYLVINRKDGVKVGIDYVNRKFQLNTVHWDHNYVWVGIMAVLLVLYGVGVALSNELVYILIAFMFVVVSLQHNDLMMALGMLGLINVPLLR